MYMPLGQHVRGKLRVVGLIRLSVLIHVYAWIVNGSLVDQRHGLDPTAVARLWRSSSEPVELPTARSRPSCTSKEAAVEFSSGEH
jgi:hypothetical protein